MWARWALASAVAVALIASIVIAIHRAGPEGPTSEAGAEAEVNRLSDIAIAEDQAPHSASLSARSAPAAALERAIASDVRQRIAKAQLTGPLQGVSCGAAGAGSAGRAPYRCTVHSAGIAYSFQAVVDKRRQRLTWCKVDPPPVAGVGVEIPISASCRA
ncbi:MAG: hypothetical protein ACLPUT_05430 [Solirubrobacteraceae bacterium]